MTPPRPRRSWLLALAAILIFGGVWAAVASRVALLPGAGFEERVTSGARCDGAAATSVVREPFVRHAGDGAPRCVQWAASFVARDKMRARVEMMVEGAGAVSIDGRSVAADDGAHPARAKTGTVDLGKGVHSFVATFRGDGEAGKADYFRVAMDDELEPHDWGIVAPLDTDSFFVRAGDALASPPRPRPVWQALLASLALALAGTLAWLAVRARRGLALPRVDLSIASGIFAAALVVRARALDLQDVCWDEGILSASRHYVHNVTLGDFYPEAWRHNLQHPPLTKWVLLVGDVLGGRDGARIEVAAFSAMAAALLFVFGRLTFGRRVGAVAGALAVVLPLWVAHGRIAGHESLILFWWGAAMVAFACWIESNGSDSLAAFACVFAATAGVFSRPTGVWLFPVLVVGWLVQSRGTALQRLRSFPLAALGGGIAAAALAYGAWPFLWSDPAEKLARMSAAWSVPWGDIEVYMGRLRLPAWHYFVVAFLGETPAILVVLALFGIALAFEPGRGRRWVAVCLCWLVFPFGQSLSTLRIGAGRYVMPAWPALLLFAAVSLVAAGDFLGDLAFDLSKRARALLRVTPAVLAFAYTGYALLRVEPYPLDYFNELLGGPAGVAKRKMFEVPWWGEGNLAAIRALNSDATPNARVHLTLWPTHALARLRDDLVQVDDATLASYVLVSHLQYVARPPPGCTLTGSIEVAGAPLVDTFHCNPVSPTQLGFGAMNRPGGADEALGHFRDALRIDPNDAGAIFGMGWASQAKGDLVRAEALYIDAAARAERANDLETEYFARFDLGTLYAQRAEHARAADAFRGALAVTARAPQRFGDRAVNAQHNLDLALEAIRRAARDAGGADAR